MEWTSKENNSRSFLLLSLKTSRPQWLWSLYIRGFRGEFGLILMTSITLAHLFGTCNISREVWANSAFPAPFMTLGWWTRLFACPFFLAAKWALTYNYNSVHIFSDCLNVIYIAVSRDDWLSLRWQILLRNLEIEIAKLSFCRISKVDRKDNNQAHSLAKRALQCFTHPTAARDQQFLHRATAFPFQL